MLLDVLFLPMAGKRDRWMLTVDGEPWREVHRTIFGAKPRFPPISHTSDLQAAFDEYEYRRVKNYVIWRLTKQSYHSEQLARALKERLVQLKNIDRVVDELKNGGFLDDEAWLQSFLRSQKKRYGVPLILAKLRAKGIATEGIAQKLEEERDDTDELAVIRQLLATRYRLRDFQDRKVCQKVKAALVRKGFSYESIATVFSEIL